MALRIKDNVDLKELEKFGFKPKYNEDTGEVCAYEKKIEKYECGLVISVMETKSLIRIFKFPKKRKNEWRINPYKSYFDIDTLYDLIKADLVEKVSD